MRCIAALSVIYFQSSQLGLVNSFSAAPSQHVPSIVLASSPRQQRLLHATELQELDEGEDDVGTSRAGTASSKREMLGFAIPALGIFLSNPLLSNIDNAFVGRLAGVSGLAALSPATICTDQVLYLFSFLSRATTGLVSRAYGTGGDVDAARRAAAAPLTVASWCGVVLTGLYAVGTPALLRSLRVDPHLLPTAAGYVYWRGAVAWAALAQSVALSVSLATRDAVTPLKIVGAAALVNVLGDTLLCAYPCRFGVAGAAAATSVATLVSCGMLLHSLRTKRLLPTLSVPTKADLRALTEFTGPLLAITVTRLVGFVSMQRRAMTLGVKSLASYQLCINVMIFFLLFGEPLSQLSQTKLPALVDQCDLGDTAITTTTNNIDNSRLLLLNTLKSVATLATLTALVVGACSFSTLTFGAGLFTQDAQVLRIAAHTAPSVFLAVVVSILCVSIDGAMLASRDFGFMLATGLCTMTVQLFLLKHYVHSLHGIFGTFTLRLGTYAVACLVRTLVLGKGALGRAVLCQGGVGGGGSRGDKKAGENDTVIATK